jgi:hypothetical protein
MAETSARFRCWPHDAGLIDRSRNLRPGRADPAYVAIRVPHGLITISMRSQ